MPDDSDRDQGRSDILGDDRIIADDCDDRTAESLWDESLSLIKKAGRLLRMHLAPAERTRLEEILIRAFWNQSPEIPSTNCIAQLLAVALNTPQQQRVNEAGRLIRIDDWRRSKV
jgi:hypothetical protein